MHQFDRVVVTWEVVVVDQIHRVLSQPSLKTSTINKKATLSHYAARSGVLTYVLFVWDGSKAVVVRVAVLSALDGPPPAAAVDSSSRGHRTPTISMLHCVREPTLADGMQTKARPNHCCSSAPLGGRAAWINVVSVWELCQVDQQIGQMELQLHGHAHHKQLISLA